MKKAEMSMTTIIGAVIALIVLVIIIVLITRSNNGLKSGTACSIKGGVCTSYSCLPDGLISPTGNEKLCSGNSPTCCKIGMINNVGTQ